MLEDDVEGVEPSDEAVARHWDANADLWTEHVRRGWDAYREHYNNPAFFAFLGEVKGKRVLDAGCGEGCNTRILAWMEADALKLQFKLLDRYVGLTRLPTPRQCSNALADDEQVLGVLEV